MAGRVQRRQAGDAAAVVELDVGLELGDRLLAEPGGRRARRRLQRRHRADMVVVVVADQNKRDLAAGGAQDRLDVLGMVRDRGPAPPRRPGRQSDRCWCRNRSSARDWRRRCGARPPPGSTAPRCGSGSVRNGIFSVFRPVSLTQLTRASRLRHTPQASTASADMHTAPSWSRLSSRIFPPVLPADQTQLVLVERRPAAADTRNGRWRYPAGCGAPGRRARSPATGRAR